MERDRFVPLPDVESKKVSFHLNFPEYIPTEQIGVNVRGIERLCRLAGIKSLRVVGIGDDEITTGVPMVAGHDQSGTAYAVKGGAQVTVPEFDYAPTTSKHHGDHRYTWIDGVINMHMNQISFAIDKRGVSIKSTEEWTKHLNRAMKDGLSQIGTNFLVFGLNRWDLGSAGIKDVSMVLFNTGNLPVISYLTERMFPGFKPVQDPKDLLGAVIMTSVLWNSVDQAAQYLKKENRIEHGRRFSFFYGPEIDRAVLLQLVSKFMTLAKAVNNPVDNRQMLAR